MRENHGLSYESPGKRSRMHSLWTNMRSRCNNVNHPNYDRYGGRGIKCCERWDYYKNFLEDMGPDPGPGWTLERKDGNKGYEPSNVEWATRQTQSRNRAVNPLTKKLADEIRDKYFKGKRQVPLANEYGISQSLVSQIIRGVIWK